MSPRSRRDRIKSLLHYAFISGQRMGVDVLPRHFYSAIPDIRELRRSQQWRAPRSLVGLLGFDKSAQLDTLEGWFPPDVRERLAGRDLQAEASAENGAVGYGPTEATLLYAFVATQRPRRVIQVGAGASTAVILAAAAEVGHDVEIVCVDPFPTDYLVSQHDLGRITLDRRPAQEVPLAELCELQAGDLFFVDSTHTVKPGSEVNRLIFEVLPRLSPGVWIHFHDIWFPYDYARDVLDAGLFFWNESPLLHAFLIDNNRVSTPVRLLVALRRPRTYGGGRSGVPTCWKRRRLAGRQGSRRPFSVLLLPSCVSRRRPTSRMTASPSLLSRAVRSIRHPATAVLGAWFVTQLLLTVWGRCRSGCSGSSNGASWP